MQYNLSLAVTWGRRASLFGCFNSCMLRHCLNTQVALSNQPILRLISSTFNWFKQQNTNSFRSTSSLLDLSFSLYLATVTQLPPSLDDRQLQDQKCPNHTNVSIARRYFGHSTLQVTPGITNNHTNCCLWQHEPRSRTMSPKLPLRRGR